MQFSEYFGEKTRKFFPVKPFFCMPCMKFLSKCPYSKKPVLPRKIPGCAPVTFSFTFHSNFHPNILVFANLPVYRKLIHDNISIVFWKARMFFLVLFWRRYKILFVHINICIIETLVGVILKKIYIIFIYKYWHYNLC